MKDNIVKRYKESKYYKKTFTIDEIDDYLKERLGAEIVKDDNFFGLINDPMVNASEIIRLYIIKDPVIVNSLYTEEERKEKQEIADAFNESICSEIRIALESEDGNHIIGYTLQNGCSKVNNILMSFRCCPEENENFHRYLKILEDIGEI